MPTKYTLISVFMLAIVAVTSWFTYFTDKPHTKLVTSAKVTPDAYMENVVALILDKQGKPSLKIVTPKLVHYAEKDTANLDSPELTLYRKSPTPWYINADTATTTDGVENVTFRENVVIHHAADDTNPATIIKTQLLYVYPNKQIAETPAPITLIQPGLKVSATGLNADMNTGNIKLLSQARGEYVPNP